MKIICIAKNYSEHIREFDGGEAPREPVFFMKPDSALLRNNEPFYIPHFSRQVDYETELVVRISRVGKCIRREFASRYYDEVGLGIDFTARDLQRKARAEGMPWFASKGFDRAATVSTEFLSLKKLGKSINDLHFTMSLNGETRQNGYTGDMIFSVDDIICHVSQYVTLKMGDLIYTGTPAGVGPVASGDVLRASLEGIELLNFDIK